MAKALIPGENYLYKLEIDIPPNHPYKELILSIVDVTLNSLAESVYAMGGETVSVTTNAGETPFLGGCFTQDCEHCQESNCDLLEIE